MSKTTKLWISPSLELRHSPTGWPELESFEWHVGQGAGAREYDDLCENKVLRQEYEDTVVAKYDADLAKAKEESILVVAPIGFLPDRIPGTFIECEGEVKVIADCRFGCKQDGYNCDNAPGCGMYKVARLKPVERYASVEFVYNPTTKECDEFPIPDNGAHSFTEGMSDPGVKHYYEETNGKDAATVGMKDSILEMFDMKMAEPHRLSTPHYVLAEVLDELNIK